MRVIFVAVAFERLAICLLGSILRRLGHRVELAFSPHLFDDQYWLSWPQAAKFFNDDRNILEQICRFHPDVVCFSCLTVNYRWMVSIARRVKELCGAKTVFGGIHISAVPEIVLEEPCVDYVCVGEGEIALPMLLDAIHRGGADRPLPNVWFRGPRGTIVKGPALPFFPDLDRLPIFEKDLWIGHAPLKTHYMTMTTRGCPYRCTYCFNNFFADLPRRNGGSAGTYLRQRSVDHFMRELQEAKRRFHVEFVHIKDDVFTLSVSWLREFAGRYRKEIGVPFHCLSHPQYLDKEKIEALKEAGCASVQFGVESADDDYKQAELRRYENQSHVDKTMELLYAAGIDRKVDHIFGCPGERIQAQETALKLYARHGVERIGTNWIVYFPGTEITRTGLREGAITEKEVDNLQRGYGATFVQSRAHVGDKLCDYLAYEFLFRALPLLPRGFRLRVGRRHVRWWPQWLLKSLGILLDWMATRKLRETRYFFFYFEFYKIAFRNWFRRRFGGGMPQRFGRTDMEPIEDPKWVSRFRLTAETCVRQATSSSLSASSGGNSPSLE